MLRNWQSGSGASTNIGHHILEFESLLYADKTVVHLDHLACKVIELLIETGETQIYVRPQITQASILKVEPYQKNNQRQTKRGEKLGARHT